MLLGMTAITGSSRGDRERPAPCLEDLEASLELCRALLLALRTRPASGCEDVQHCRYSLSTSLHLPQTKLRSAPMDPLPAPLRHEMLC